MHTGVPTTRFKGFKFGLALRISVKLTLFSFDSPLNVSPGFISWNLQDAFSAGAPGIAEGVWPGAKVTGWPAGLMVEGGCVEIGWVGTRIGDWVVESVGRGVIGTWGAKVVGNCGWIVDEIGGRIVLGCGPVPGAIGWIGNGWGTPAFCWANTFVVKQKILNNKIKFDKFFAIIFKIFLNKFDFILVLNLNTWKMEYKVLIKFYFCKWLFILPKSLYK